MDEESDPEIGCGGGSVNYGNLKSSFAPTPAAPPIQIPPQYKPLTLLEKKFLLAVERGDLPAVRRLSSFHLKDNFMKIYFIKIHFMKIYSMNIYPINIYFMKIYFMSICFMKFYFMNIYLMKAFI